MKLMSTKALRATGTFSLTIAIAFVAAVPVLEVRAQQPTSSDSLGTLMQHRQEISNRAVEEANRRRIEDRKSDSTFPSDMRNAKNPGVVHALTPEERKALKQNERGLDLFDKGKHDDAIKAYQEAIRLDPKLAAAHNNLGSTYFALGRFAEAAAAFRSACELDSDYGQAFFNLALTQIKLGQQKEANKTLDEALLAYNSAGETHFKAGRLKEAEEAFRGMLQIDPEYAPALIRLGLVYNSGRRYEEAVQTVRRVAERQPSNSAAHEILAEAFYGQKKYEEAAASADRAIKLTPDSAEAHYLAGLARASLGQRDPALVHLNRLEQLKATDLAQHLSDFINQKVPKSNDE